MEAETLGDKQGEVKAKALWKMRHSLTRCITAFQRWRPKNQATHCAMWTLRQLPTQCLTGYSGEGWESWRDNDGSESPVVTLTPKLGEMKAETAGKTLGDVEAQALLDTLLATLS